MRVPVVLPKWGMTMHEGTIAEWMLGPGENVAAGEVLATVETEKAVGEVEAPVSGRLAEIVVQETETVDIGTVIAYIETEDAVREGT